MLKGPINQKDIILNVYALNTRVLKYMKQNLIELKGEIGKYTIIARDFSATLNN